MGRGWLGRFSGTTAVVAGFTWIHFNSTIYPYTIHQPSSVRHVVLTMPTTKRPVDFFFPSLGSYTTNLNVYTTAGNSTSDQVAELRSNGGMNIHRVSWEHLAGQREPLMRADFHGLAGRWTVEQVCFAEHDTVWHVTISYDVRYARTYRTILLRMMESFRLHR